MSNAMLLGRVFKYKKGVKPKYLVEEEIENGIPYLTAKYFRQNKPEAYTKDLAGNRFVKVNADDVILIWDGSNAGDVFKGLAGALASTMVKFEKNDKVLDDFLFFFLKTKFTLLNSKTTGSTIPHVSKNILDNLELPYYPLPEQRKIAYVLSTVQKAIEQQDKLIRHTTQLKKALMQKLFTEGIHNEKQKQTEIGLVPESWEVMELGDVCEFTRGPFGGSLKKEIFVKNGYVVYEQSHAIHGDLETFRYFIDENKFNEMKRFEVKEGDLIMSCSGTFGKIQIIPSQHKRGIINQALLKLKPTNINRNFLKLMIESTFFQNQLKSNILGVAIQNVASVSVLKRLYAVLPSFEEQEIIVKKVKLFQTKIELHQKKKQTLSDLFKTLLHELMTGQRRVHEIKFEALNKIYTLGETPLRKVAEE